MSSAQQPLSLKHAEAQDRAALLDVTAYDVALDLDRGDETFGSVSTISVRSQGGPTFVEVQPVTLNAVTVNGRAVDVTRLDRGRVPIETDPGENVVVVDAVMRYRHDGEGLHRSVDPADGRHYVYAMTFLDAAPSIFGCFDQPDLKAVWRAGARAARLGRARQHRRPPRSAPGAGTLAETQPLSTYLVDPGRRAVPRGPQRARRHPARPAARARRSRRHLDDDAEEIFTVTAQSFDEFHRLFGDPLPVRRLPPGLRPGVQRRRDGERGLRHVPRPADLPEPGDRARSTSSGPARSCHEMAHMWFGDLVTPVWWDDLWLNESFAEYMGPGSPPTPPSSPTSG